MPMNVYMYDLRIDNAHVYDPRSGIDRMGSIGIIYPNIAEVFVPEEMAERKIRICAHKVLDAKGMYVVPGLIDYHSHIFPGMGFSVCEQDLYRHGVTATVDQGSATHTSFPEDRRRFIDPAKMTVNATLMISSFGWLQQDIFSVPCRELINLEKLIRMIEIHKDVVVGVKSEVQTDDAELARYILKCQHDACRATGTHMVCHISGCPIPMDEALSYFDEDDVICHTYNAVGRNKVVDDRFKVLDCVWDAKKRGVKFDTARGHRHWNVPVARASFDQGFFPDIVTADSTALGDKPLTCQLPTIMSEVMALGMPFDEVLAAVTYTPAALMKGVSCGIRRGNPANLTVLDLREGPVNFMDASGNPLAGDKLIVPAATVIKGEVVYNAL